MTSKVEIRANIKFCFKLGKTATETFEMIKQAHGEDAMNRKNVFKWFALFRDGRQEIEDEFRPGRPKESRTDENVKKVADALKTDSNLSIRSINEMTGIPKSTVQQIIVQDLNRKRVYARKKSKNGEKKGGKKAPNSSIGEYERIENTNGASNTNNLP